MLLLPLRGAWTPDPKFKGCETRPIVLTNVWFTMATNQRRDASDATYSEQAYGDINVTYRPALWASLAVSFTVPVGLALAARRDRAARRNESGRLSM